MEQFIVGATSFLASFVFFYYLGARRRKRLELEEALVLERQRILHGEIKSGQYVSSFGPWWLKSRESRLGSQIGSCNMAPCREWYVPFWAWPFAFFHRLVFVYGRCRLVAIDQKDIGS